MRAYLLLGLELSAPFLLAFGCGSGEGAGQSSGGSGAGGASATSATTSTTSTTSSGAAGGADAGGDPSHPPGDGKHISEADACNLLSNARAMARFNKPMCSGASPSCPDLLRSMFTTACLQYDQGSVQGCISQYFAAPTCEALLKAFDECTVTAFPGSQPAGCPDQ